MFKKIFKTSFHLGALLLAAAVFASQASAQSSDPDRPSPLTNGTIVGESTGGVSDKKTYYYSFNVRPGSLTMTTDMDPVKGTGGGVIYWTYLDSRFKQLRYDAYAAQGGPVRKVNDAKITVKRKIILKLEVEGQMSYKIRFTGSALQ
jgi:hypothetical protein